MQTFTRSRTMRHTVFFLALGLVASLWMAPLASAQPSPEQMKERMAARTDSLIKHLNLTADQEAPVRAILEAGNTRRMELMAAARESGSFMGMREDMAALDEETETKLGDVLTKEQMATYKKIQEEQRSRRGRRRGM